MRRHTCRVVRFGVITFRPNIALTQVGPTKKSCWINFVCTECGYDDDRILFTRIMNSPLRYAAGDRVMLAKLPRTEHTVIEVRRCGYRGINHSYLLDNGVWYYQHELLKGK